MKRTFTLALLIGAVVGALCGLGESLVWLHQIAWWRLDVPTLYVAMGLYGGIGAVAAAVWSLFAQKMGLATFQRRVLIFSSATMVYLIGGFYVSWLCFPKIYELSSLIFLGTTTFTWFTLAVFLLRSRSSENIRAVAADWGRVIAMILGLIILTGLFFVLRTRFHFGTVRSLTSDNKQTAHRPNVMLIVMDTTRADHLSSYGHPRATTPNVDLLAEEGILFEQAASTGPWTLPSHASIFTGLLPSQHGADWPHQRLDDRFTTLAEILRSKDYQTAGFSNNPWISHGTNFHQGFDYYEETWHFGRLFNRLAVIRIIDRLVELEKKNRDDDADLTNRDILRWFGDSYDSQKPYFLFINYIEPHFSYEPPEPFRSRFLHPDHREAAEAINNQKLSRIVPPVHFDEKRRAALTDLYDGEIAYLDFRIGELTTRLKKKGLLDNTVLIILADHGENIGDHEIFEHQFCVYQTLLHVPLILRFPEKLPQGIRISEPVSLVDVVPTVLNLVGVEADELQPFFAGKSLVVEGKIKAAKDSPIFSEYAAPLPRLEKYRLKNEKVDESYFKRSLKSMRRGRYEYIWASDGQNELYDLSQDPGETQNIIEKFPDVAQKMAKELHDRLQSMKSPGTPESVGTMDETTRDQIRALGYLH